MKNKPDRYLELDALRGMAALMVVLFHFTLGRPDLRFSIGTTGVDLFFIISGFVIFMSLTKVKTSKDFIINRISRLYPTYWTCVTITFLVMFAYSILKHSYISPIQYIANMTMFQFYFKVPNIDTSYWTMIVEMLFYIGILILFHFRKLKYLNIIGLIVSLVIVCSIAFFNSSLIKWIITIIPVLQFIPLFFAGTLFYKIFTEKRKLMENYGLILICLICQLFLFKYSGYSSRHISHMEYAIMLTIYFSLFTLFVNGKLKFIVCKATLFLGKISFALYLIHQYISMNFIIPILVNKFKLNFWIASLCISLPIVIILATIITYKIEIPLGKKLKEKLLGSSNMQLEDSKKTGGIV